MGNIAVRIGWTAALFLLLAGASHAASPPPRPLEGHPGNIFLQGEEVSIPVPEDAVGTAHWRLLDDRQESLTTGETPGAGALDLGKPAIGWYRLEFLDAEGNVATHTNLAVLHPFNAPVPDDSPLCIDAALSWFKAEAPEQLEQLANLAALAGTRWIRDRVRWREMQTGPDEFAGPTKYDKLADVQAAQGLNILQVFHGTPEWAAGDPELRGRCPSDLRHAYRFCKAMAKRFAGQVQAWEPWNEGNAHNFGGHTIDELCAMQKAGYLGFKAGNPEVIVGWNPLGGIDTPAHAKGVLDSETPPYFDTYNIHSYDWPHDYDRLWAPAREAAAGRPMWVTESDRGLKAIEGSDWGDFSHENDVLKAEYMAHEFASALFAGADHHFHFILGHFMELHGRPIQFGLLRKDLTPRPSYVAMATLGRFLAGGQCLGRWMDEAQPEVYVYAFRAEPDGQERDVLVAWTEVAGDWPKRGKAHATWTLPEGMAVEAVYDYLGRPVSGGVPEELRSAALFVIVPKGESAKLNLTPSRQVEARAAAPQRHEDASEVVLQLLMPGETRLRRREGWTDAFERSAKPGEPASLEVAAYNFGDAPVEGTIRLESAPEGWKFEPAEWPVKLGTMGREVCEVRLEIPADYAMALGEWVKFRGDFGKAGKPCLAFRMIHPNDATEDK